MNKELFRSMRLQMQPSGEARSALTEQLASTKRKTVPVGRYVAIAACAAVIVAAVPVYGMVRDHLRWQAVLNGFFHRNAVVEVTQPHSYVMASELYCRPEDGSAMENMIDTGAAGDRDQDMTPGELTDNLLEAGFSREDTDAYLASGWQMTWGKWWKFYHLTEESGDRTLEALLTFSREEGLAVNTGDADIPGGAFVGGAPDQSGAIMAYQNLMDRFKADYGPDRYPEWYGGAYIDEHAGLIVNIAASCEPEDKELYFQIQDWAGSDRIGFGSSELSLNQLRELQDKVFDAMCGLGLEAGCGVNEETGQVELTLPAATDEAMWKLAELDPAGAAVLVIVGEFIAMDLTEDPVPVAPSVSHSVQPGEGNVDPRTPVSNMPGMVVDADGVIAYEPQG
ncbi:MAG: hypothetical protein HDT14_10770 [Oscillibacter sp.]|nr:hypothetical protein [Oscillibacter sp.]